MFLLCFMTTFKDLKVKVIIKLFLKKSNDMRIIWLEKYSNPARFI